MSVNNGFIEQLLAIFSYDYSLILREEGYPSRTFWFASLLSMFYGQYAVQISIVEFIYNIYYIPICIILQFLFRVNL